MPTLRHLLTQALNDPHEYATAVNTLAVITFYRDGTNFGSISTPDNPAHIALEEAGLYISPEEDEEFNAVAEILRKVDRENDFHPPICAFFESASAYLNAIKDGRITNFALYDNEDEEFHRYHDTASLIFQLKITDLEGCQFVPAALANAIYSTTLWRGGKLTNFDEQGSSEEISLQDIFDSYARQDESEYSFPASFEIYTQLLLLAYPLPDDGGDRKIIIEERPEFCRVRFDRNGAALVGTIYKNMREMIGARNFEY